MPCVEIADAIVQTGRETLEKVGPDTFTNLMKAALLTISLKSLETIHFTPKWGAQVVYGDTDSLFVYLPGKSKEDAFKIGHEIAATITSQNPQPIKLKFEKVKFSTESRRCLRCLQAWFLSRCICRVCSSPRNAT